jgi:hypothetical protein
MQAAVPGVDVDEHRATHDGDMILVCWGAAAVRCPTTYVAHACVWTLNCNDMCKDCIVVLTFVDSCVSDLTFHHRKNPLRQIQQLLSFSRFAVKQ